TRCELAEALLGYGFPRSQLGEWVCLAESESSLVTNATHLNKNGTVTTSIDYGIFQISNKFWCYPTAKGGCKIPCQSLLDDDISDDAGCAVHVYEETKKLKKSMGIGFSAWEGWKKRCRGKDLEFYLRGCKL
ncbi:unnamed protein product, partial [Darwinula stevensoni]